MTSNTNSPTTTHIRNPNPIKRRSRPSKRTPTTHLTANPADFRALVQQFTGYHRTKTVSTSCLIGNQKGPVTLNFQLGSVSFQNSNESWSDYDQIQPKIEPKIQQEVVDKRFSGDVLFEDSNVESRSGEVELDEFGSMTMGDGFDPMDDFDFDALNAVIDQNFDQGCFWNVHNQYQDQLMQNGSGILL